MAEEASARAGAGAETRACHHDLLGSWGRTSNSAGWSAKGSVNTQNLASPAPCTLQARRLGLLLPLHHSSASAVQLPAPPVPPPVPRRNSLEHKAHALLKPLITGLLPKALATPNCSKYLSRPGFVHTSADAVPSAWKALPAPLPAQLQLKTPLPREALPLPAGRGCHIVFQLSAFPFVCPLGCEHSTSHS